MNGQVHALVDPGKLAEGAGVSSSPFVQPVGFSCCPLTQVSAHAALQTLQSTQRC